MKGPTMKVSRMKNHDTETQGCMLWVFPDAAPKDERHEAENAWGEDYTELMTGIRPGRVIARYGVMPHPELVERELSNLGARNINSAKDTRYIAKAMWSIDLDGLTPPVYRDRWHELPEGAYIVKGETNSVKGLWNSHVYAATRGEIGDRFNATMDALYFNPQDVIVRPYVPLEAWERDYNGAPVTNEWRCFFLGGEFLAGGYYWVNWEEEAAERLSERGHKDLGVLPEGALEVALKAVDRLTVPFVCLDVARVDPEADPDKCWGFEPGSWIVVEVNDGCQAGLASIDPALFYGRLREATKKL